jgi:hypothetical protein
MATYYERYINGEYEQVWNELIALGDRVREEPVYSDARAVATETMQRAKRNIEKLYARLQNLGYEFLIEKPASTSNPLQGLSQQLKDDPLLGNVFGSMLSGLESLQSLLSSMGSTAQPPRTYHAYMPPEPDIEQQIQAFELEIGKLPLSIRAWCEVVGSVDFLGDYPGLASYTRKTSLGGDVRGMIQQMMLNNPQAIPTDDVDEDTFNEYLDSIKSPFPLKDMGRLMREEMQAAKDTPPSQEPAEIWWTTDPLAFDFRLDVDEAQEEIEAQQEYEDEEMELATGTFGLIVAPDIHHKANFSGSTYDVILPDARADTLVYGTDMYFVAYLRKSFEWAGFPGLEDYPERDEQLLDNLKAGLEPL